MTTQKPPTLLASDSSIMYSPPKAWNMGQNGASTMTTSQQAQLTFNDTNRGPFHRQDEKRTTTKSKVVSPHLLMSYSGEPSPNNSTPQETLSDSPSSSNATFGCSTSATTTPYARPLPRRGSAAPSRNHFVRESPTLST
ncbi:hypothetical protein BDP27DRAFT_1432886 [Rhodocollybia butyracea]|uniref:Uncharacterized protein n=1 Tax=Rhodocollybia butyracea TaxID=206335 RepID=A0A9P5TWH0_9AGAR|nr:hypothetical protein BDP27DRAFT_1432886 [Rhodocollybia butyracea]